MRRSTSLLLLCAFFLTDVTHSMCVGTGPVSRHNCLPGASMSEWNVNVGVQGSFGFTDRTAYNPGATVNIKTSDRLERGYDISVYRFGYYGGDGAYLIGKGQPVHDEETLGGAIIIGRFALPIDTPSGLYMASAVYFESPADPSLSHVEDHMYDLRSHLRHERQRKGLHAFFIVEALNRSAAEIIYRVADSSWATSTQKNGRFIYDAPQVRSRETAATSVFSVDFPAIKFLESLGLEIAYIDTADVDRKNGMLKDVMGECKVYVQSATEAYRSRLMRRFLADLPGAGIHRLFLGVAAAPHPLVWDSTFRSFSTLSEDNSAIEETQSTWGYIQWHPKPLIVGPEYTSQRFWMGSRLSRSVTASFRLHRSAIGRVVGETSPRDAPFQAVACDTTLDWSMGPTKFGLRHVNNASHRVVLQRDRVTRAVTFHGNSDQFTHALDAFRDSIAAPLDTPVGHFEQRIHVERDVLGAEPAIQQLIVNVLGFMKLSVRAAPHGVVINALSRDEQAPSCSFTTVAAKGNTIYVRLLASDIQGSVNTVVARVQGTPTFTSLRRIPSTDQASVGEWEGTINFSDAQPHHRVECYATDDSVNTNYAPGIAAISFAESEDL